MSPSAARLKVTDLQLADHRRPVLETVRHSSGTDDKREVMLNPGAGESF